MPKKILIVDDEPDILDILKYVLEKEGFKVRKAKNGEEAIERAYDEKPDLILLDIMMPKKDGIEVCRQLRNDKKFNETFIVFLTARNEEYSEVAGFDVGADDYVVKPIKPRSLISRINSLFLRKRYKTEDNETITFDDLLIDLTRMKVFVKKKEIFLTKKEFDILLLLSSKPEKVFSRNSIYHKVWGDATIVGERTLDVHIRKIREKIGEKYISTIKGMGYSFTY
ncbi:MAG: response regulator transcription factor [Saprospiraceae bacterium]|nr:response regulator transcription factor [Saprospiraceae bacterium]